MKGNHKYALQEKNLFGFNETNDYIRQYENGPIKPSQRKDTHVQATKFTFGDEKENDLPDKHHGLEGKIRKERDEMEKKLKEKWFQKKMDCSMPSELYKLRAEYITTFIDR